MFAQVKGKKGPSKVVNDQRARGNGSGTFKIYTENEKNKVSGGGSTDSNFELIPMQVNKVPTQTNANSLQGRMKHFNNSKGNWDTHGRKALADVSNVKGCKLRNSVRDCLMPLDSECPCTKRMSSSSRKPSVLKENLDQGVINNHTRKGVAIKHLKASSNNHAIINQVRSSLKTDDRLTSRKPPLPTRKSLPVMKTSNTLGTNNLKKNDHISVNDKGKSGIPVARKMAPNVSNARGHLWRNRSSDGFILMGMRDRTEGSACHVSRKPGKVLARTSNIISNARIASNSKRISGLEKSASVAASSSKKKGQTVTFSSENATSVVCNELTQAKVMSDANKSSSSTSSNMAVKIKSGRRRSYTSSLMAGSKLLEGVGEVMEQEKLQSIDDFCNHLEVAEYVGDLYQFYWVMEAEAPSLADYMIVQTEISPQMRDILVNWLIEVHFKFDLMPETLYLMVSLLDRYLSLVTVKKNEMQLVGLTALLLASKYEDFWHPRVKDLTSISIESYTKEQVLEMEKLMLKSLKFRLNVPTPYVFMLRFIKAAQPDKKLEQLAFYLIELCLVEYEALKFKPSLLCASAIYVARHTLQVNPPWTLLLTKYTRYEESQIRDCAETILRFHKAAKTGMLNVTYEKYQGPNCNGIAAIKPLDQLP